MYTESMHTAKFKTYGYRATELYVWKDSSNSKSVTTKLRKKAFRQTYMTSWLRGLNMTPRMPSNSTILLLHFLSRHMTEVSPLIEFTDISPTNTRGNS